MTAARGPARWPFVLALALSLAAIGTLAWLRGRVVREERAFLAYAVRLFELSGVLPRPEDDAVRFARVESIARSIEERDLVQELVVTKFSRRTGREHALHPVAKDIAQPGWREAWEGQILDVKGGGEPLGRLYIRVDTANRSAIDRAIAAFTVLLVACLGILVTRARGTEAELGRTISELEQRRAEVIRLERLALAGQLSANILHDLKKPVLNIKHEIADAGQEPSRELLDGIARQTELFLSMLRELGIEQFVRAEGEQEEFCDLADVADKAAALVRYERGGVAIANSIPRDGTVPLVMAMPHRLVQLFSNLVLNACQAMNGKGSIEFRAFCADGQVCVEVADDGPGIPESVHARLFEPFVTTKADRDGSGLGLFICAKIVAEMGGSIELADAPRGARFLVRLPAAKTS